jgi:hypothetical protein
MAGLSQVDMLDARIELKYSSSRKEVSDWYWRMWRSKFWKLHLICFLTPLLVILIADAQWPPSPKRALTGASIGLGLIAFMILFPQILFKPQTRVILFDEDGIQTTIGKKNANVPWQEIESIDETVETIAIRRKNLHAFLLPRRAFSSDEHRRYVLATILQWKDEKHRQL